jgi:hypothetical protein
MQHAEVRRIIDDAAGTFELSLWTSIEIDGQAYEEGFNTSVDTRWKWGGITDIRSVTPQLVMRVLTRNRQKKPASEEKWNDYGLDLKWATSTWELKSQYTTPRDTVSLLQLQHRNLYVAKSLGLADTRCRAHGCNEPENQTHHFRCRKIQTGFWEPVNKAMRDLGFQVVKSNEPHWIGCQRTGGLEEAVSSVQGRIRHDRRGVEEPVRRDGESADGRQNA